MSRKRETDRQKEKERWIERKSEKGNIENVLL